jgi:Ca-activated chloride channel family protein
MSDALGEILQSAGIDGLTQPGWFVAALFAAVVATWLAWRARPPAVGWPGEPEARAARARRGDPLRGLALGLRGAALAALAAVLAGPVGVHRAPPEPGFGLDLVLVVDASGSMRALDAELGGEWHTRLDLARQVVARFARQRAAEGDRVALVVLGETAFTQCPLTSDGGLLAAALERVEAGMAGEATALGDALALAVKRARAAAASGDLTLGHVAVLLSDGRHNAGTLSVEAATALAAAEGLRVHTVAIGSQGEEVPMASAAGSGVGGRGLRFERHDVDFATLERIAAATGGRFFPARSASDLDAVYAEIDALERVGRPRPARLRQTDRPEPLLALAGGLLLGEIALARVARRRLP